MVSIKTKIVKYLQRVLGITQAPKPLYTKDFLKHTKFAIGDYTYGHPAILFENDDATLSIGKFCSISSNVTIFLGGNHRYDWNTTYPFNTLNEEFPFAKKIEGHPSTNGDVTIGNDVWIAQGVTIMSGITIGNGAILATNSVITKDIGPYEIWGGNPCKLIRKRFDDEKIAQLQKLKWWEKDLSFIEKNINALCSDKNLNEAEWDNGLAYDQAIVSEFEKLNKEHQYVLNEAGHGKDILEVACHTGYVSNWLKKHDNRVTGMELFQPALDKAKPYLVNSILGNVEDSETWDKLNSQKFDVILFMHILEHLVEPKKVLEFAKKHLKEDGKIVICIPNISNWNSRLNVFRGNFSYTETGLMDKTHLRFVNYFTMIELIEAAGYKVAKYGCVSKSYFNLFPNFKLIWRLNKPYNKLVHRILRKKPNMTDVVLNFTIELDD